MLAAMRTGSPRARPRTRIAFSPPRRMAMMPLSRSDLPRARGALAATAGAALVAGLLGGAPALADGGDDGPELLGTASELGVDVPSHGDELTVPEDAIPGRWLVEVEGAPTLRGGNGAANGKAQDKVVQRAKAESIPMDVQATFVKGWNGMSVTMDDADVEKLRGVQGVKAVYPVLEVAAPDPVDAEPEDVFGNAMTGVDQVQQVDGLTGEGVTVAVIDSGIDYNNPDLGGSGVNDETLDF